MTTRVDIEKEKFDSIQFPDVCPVCNKATPDSFLNMRTYITINQPFKEEIGAKWRLDVPVCQNHKKNITIGRWISGLLFLVLLTIAALILYFIWYFIGNQGDIIDGIIIIAVMAVMIYVHSKVYSPPLLMESFSYRILFTFKNDNLAEKFARLNGIDTAYDSMNQSRKLAAKDNEA